jgi:hypothetical protein
MNYFEESLHQGDFPKVLKKFSELDSFVLKNCEKVFENETG